MAFQLCHQFNYGFPTMSLELSSTILFGYQGSNAVGWFAAQEVVFMCWQWDEFALCGVCHPCCCDCVATKSLAHFTTVQHGTQSKQECQKVRCTNAFEFATFFFACWRRSPSIQVFFLSIHVHSLSQTLPTTKSLKTIERKQKAQSRDIQHNQRQSISVDSSTQSQWQSQSYTQSHSLQSKSQSNT